MRNLSLILLFSAFILGSCYKDNFDDTQVTTVNPEPEIIVDAHLVGEVKDLQDERQTEYSIVINGDDYSPKNGLIELALDHVNEISQSVYINTNDGRDAFINLPLLRNDISYAEIYLFPRLSEVLLKSFGLNLINIENNIQLAINTEQFPSGSGNNDITIAHRSLSENKLSNQIGNRAYDNQGVESVLDIDKAFQIDWFTSQNPNLELLTGEQGQLTINNVSNLGQKALFKYSVKDEYWVWVSEITTSESTIPISESGYYIIANYYPAIIAKSQLIMDMKPVAYQSLKIETLTDGLELYTRTTSMGKWISLVPKSQDLNIQLQNTCDEFITEFSFTSPANDTEFTPQELMSLQNNFVNLNTIVLNCEGEEQQNTVITIQESGFNSTYQFNGENPDVWISSCDDDLSIFASNEETGFSGPIIEWNTNISDNVNFLSDCTEFEDGYSFIQIRDDKKIFNSFVVNFDGERTILSSQDGEVKFSFKGNTAKKYEESEVNIFIEDNMFGDKGYFISCENSNVGCGINNCSVTHYAELDGEWMRLSFSGTLWMQTINPPIAGNYQVKGLIMAKK